MRNNFLCFLCFSLLVSQIVSSQNNKQITKFILPGCEILDTLSGDLNLDGRKDLLLILKSNTEDTAISELARPLLILIRQADGSLKQEARNDESVLCKQCGGVFGDPYSIMVIKNGFFSVEHYGGSADRWTDIVTFKYNKEKKNWFLYKHGGEGFNIFDPEKKTTWLKTTKDFGIVEFEKFKQD